MSQGKRSTFTVLAAAVTALMVVPIQMSAGAQTGNQPLGNPEEVALAHLRDDPAGVGLERADVADLAVASSYTSTHNGVTHVNLNQRLKGLEVFGAYATVNVASDGEVLFVGDSMVKGLAVDAPGSSDLDATEAVVAAASALDLTRPKNLRVLRRSSNKSQETVVSSGGISDEPIPARVGWQPTADGLRLAWQVVIDDSSDSHLWNATVDAQTGELLDVEDWTSEDSVEGLASALARPSRRGAAASGLPALASPDPVDDGSGYRVFALPKESPNDGPRTLVTNPADALTSPFGWHDDNGVDGAEFTITRGNNVHAYLDQDANNAADFGDTDGGGGLDFDFPADLNEHAQNYRDAVTTNLFYWNNVFHDVMSRYGFDEASGNFQATNYGGLGTGGDYVRAEAADGGGTNNANFSTPAADGGTPRMQMFLWPGNQFGRQNQVVVDEVGSFGASWSRFGPAPTPSGTTGELALVDDGSSAPTEGCGTLIDFPAGAIAVVDRGTCTFLSKVENAQTAGASAVILANNTGGNPPVLTGSMVAPPPTIPAVAVTQDDGNTIKAALGGDPVTGTVRKHPDHPGIRDGDFENGIIIHEYGHGVSLRLTGGPGVNCLTGAEQAGEGWSDFLAISMLLDPALDDPEGPRGMGPYALFQDSREGAGIRPAPYSRNMAIQPFSYDSIKSGGWLNGTSLALPHGLGHGWAAVLWDMTWDLVDKHGFNPDVYAPWDTGGNNRALQYVIDGLKFQGCAPGLVVARDAIIAAADELSGGEDTCTVWASFARRGLGFSAVQGSTDRNDNAEAFDTHPECRAGFFGGVSDGPNLNDVERGATVPLVFTLGGNQGLDILVENSPYSRQVNCDTLRTDDPESEFTTPRPLPVNTETPGKAKLSYDKREDRYTYPWKTLTDWAGTCREVVVTRTDGIQHRAFFRFTPWEPLPEPPLLEDIADVAAGWGHTCAITTEATASCWGRNATGQIGNGVVGGDGVHVPLATQVRNSDDSGPLTGVAQIAGGDGHTCALTDAGTVYCWGASFDGRLGDGNATLEPRPLPVAVRRPDNTGPLTGVAQISVGSQFGCAVTDAGDLYCWGNNASGKLGIGRVGGIEPLPVAVRKPDDSGPLTGVTSIATGSSHGCAVADGITYCWGGNFDGQVGNGQTGFSEPLPVQVRDSDGSGPLADVAQLSAAAGHTCAMTGGGVAYCWGRNDSGQIGTGTVGGGDRPLPVEVRDTTGSGTLGAVTAVVTGDNHTCALAGTESAYCWGSNSHAQLGFGELDATPRPLPVEVRDSEGAGPFTEAVSLTAGNAHTCALSTTATVYCWGGNFNRQLGIGNTLDEHREPLPVRVRAGTN
jgi:extracellular elastinolytic metalloproteinase